MHQLGIHALIRCVFKCPKLMTNRTTLSPSFVLGEEDMKRSITVTGLSVCLFGGIAAADEISMHFDAFGGHESYRIALDGRLSADSSDEVNYVGGITAGERLWTNQYGAEVVTYCIRSTKASTWGTTTPSRRPRTSRKSPSLPRIPAR